jgi:hypothetical protein
MTYRSRKLLDAAKEVPRCMGCGKHNIGDVVMAHANWSEYGKGSHHKAHDWAVAALCTLDCHAYVDSSKASREDKKDFWIRAHVKTLEWLFESGKVTVK